MSGYRDIWATLGIARTTDVAAIRSAYARALKGFDVDADPGRFMALRNARDHALRLARQQPAPAALPDIADETHADDRPDGEDDATLSLVTPAAPDPAQITAHIAALAAGGTVSTAIPTAPEGDYRNDPARTASSDSGDGIPLPDLTTRATLAPPVLDAAPRRGAVAVAISDSAHEALIDQHYDAVRRLLAPRHDRAVEVYLDPADELSLAGHMDALLADPRLEQIAFREQAAAWFAEVAANAVPRSDSIVERLVATFGWAADRGRIDQPRNVARVLARRDSLVFFRLVQDRKHPLNAAWRELVRPAQAGSRRGFRVNRGDVQRLLKVVRENFPDLESCFDWYRVSLWEAPGGAKGGGGAWRPAYFALILMLGVLRAVFSDSGSHAPVVTPVPLPAASMSADQRWIADAMAAGRRKTTDPATDIAAALRSFAGGTLSYDELRRANPALADDLEKSWQAAHRSDDLQSAFVQRTRQELVRRANIALDHPTSYALAAESRRLELDQLKARRAIDPAACVALLVGGEIPSPVRINLFERQQALSQHAVLASRTDIDTTPHATTFTIPGEVMATLGKRTGLPRAALDAALDRRGAPAKICEARIALIEAALALPAKDGLKLLRDM